MADEDIFIQSRMPADNGYGQPGYQGPSSDLPGKKTTSGFLPASKVPEDNWQTRKVDATPIAAHSAMLFGRKNVETVPVKNSRAVTQTLHQQMHRKLK